MSGGSRPLNGYQAYTQRQCAERIVQCRVVLLDRLPPYKRFCLSQYLKGKTQKELAKMLAISQPSVGYIIQWATFRCLELSQLPPRPSEAMAKKAFAGLPGNTQEIMLLMFRHEIQSAAAEELGRTQGYVRHWYLKGLRDMKEGRVQDWMREVKRLGHVERSQFFVGRLPFSIPSGKALLALAEWVLQARDKSRTRST